MYVHRSKNRTLTLARALDGIGVRLIAGAVLFLYFGWWTRQFWISLALAMGLVFLLSWGYYLHRQRHRRSGHDREALACGIRAMSEERLGELVKGIFENLPDFTHLTRTGDGLLAEAGRRTVLIGWDQPEKGGCTSLGQWVAFLKNIREQKADRGILISGGGFDRECRLAAQTCGNPRVELVDPQALARLASASGQAVGEPPPGGTKQKPRLVPADVLRAGPARAVYLLRDHPAIDGAVFQGVRLVLFRRGCVTHRRGGYRDMDAVQKPPPLGPPAPQRGAAL